MYTLSFCCILITWLWLGIPHKSMVTSHSHYHRGLSNFSRRSATETWFFLLQKEEKQDGRPTMMVSKQASHQVSLFFSLMCLCF